MGVAGVTVGSVYVMRYIKLFVTALGVVFTSVSMFLQISDDSPLVFSGAYCQYNPLNCPLARDDNGLFKPCAGIYILKSIYI